MKHRHLNHENHTLAAIDSILERGTMVDWLPLLAIVKLDPNGEISNKILTICDNHHIYGITNFFRNAISVERREFLIKGRAKLPEEIFHPEVAKLYHSFSPKIN